MDKDLQGSRGPRCSIFEATPGTETQGFLSDSIRSDGENDRDQQNIITPKSLRQQILKECHDVPFIGHVGMRKTLETSGQTIPLARTTR